MSNNRDSENKILDNSKSYYKYSLFRIRLNLTMDRIEDVYPVF